MTGIPSPLVTREQRRGAPGVPSPIVRPTPLSAASAQRAVAAVANTPPQKTKGPTAPGRDLPNRGDAIPPGWETPATRHARRALPHHEADATVRCVSPARRRAPSPQSQKRRHNNKGPTAPGRGLPHRGDAIPAVWETPATRRARRALPHHEADATVGYVNPARRRRCRSCRRKIVGASPSSL